MSITTTNHNPLKVHGFVETVVVSGGVTVPGEVESLQPNKEELSASASMTLDSAGQERTLNEGGAMLREMRPSVGHQEHCFQVFHASRWFQIVRSVHANSLAA